jgi:predicted double-glycine peptidase
MTRARAAAFLLILLAGAGFVGVSRVTDDHPSIHLLDAVPDVVQSTNYSCGPSALQAVLAYYGIIVSEKDLIREAKTNPDIGAELEDLATVAQKHGLEACVRDGLKLDDLEGEVRAGYPPLVLNQSWREDSRVPWPSEWDSGHYVVVIGMDDRFIYVEDPVLEGTRGVIPRREFVDRWHDWTRDKERAWGQGLFIHGRPHAAALRAAQRFERVR